MSTKQEFGTILGLRGVAANIGAAHEKSFLAWQRGDNDLATEWDKLASDILFLGRFMARDGISKKLSAEYSACMDRWDDLNKQATA